MPELRNWNTTLVIQRDPELGCIPAGYEWLIRYMGIKGVDFNHFQEEFNLQAQGKAENNFDSVAKAVELGYPYVRIKWKSFKNGSDKVSFVEDLIVRNTACLISLALSPRGGWHIVPVIGFDLHDLRLIWVVDSASRPRIEEIAKMDVIWRHDNWPGGNDVAWLDGD